MARKGSNDGNIRRVANGGPSGSKGSGAGIGGRVGTMNTHRTAQRNWLAQQNSIQQSRQASAFGQHQLVDVRAGDAGRPTSYRDAVRIARGGKGRNAARDDSQAIVNGSLGAHKNPDGSISRRGY